jgi:hypothetical protein
MVAAENSKFEARNPKQIQMIQIQMTQTIIIGRTRFVADRRSMRETSGVECAIHPFVSVIGISVLRACFEFRASDFEFGRQY